MDSAAPAPRNRATLAAEKAAETAELRSDGLAVRFPDPKTGQLTEALSGIDLLVTRGEFVSIIGPSGCGKTTFINCIAGLQAYEGTLKCAGDDITGPSRNRALVFQTPSLFPWKTVLRNVTYGLEVAKENKRTAQAAAMATIKLVGLEGFEHHRPGQLSGGMQQRVNLARAIVVNPEIILLDEPFASLDAQTRELMQTELYSVWGRTGKTAILITHQIDEAIYLSQRVVVMSRRPGRVLEIVDIPFGQDRPDRKSTRLNSSHLARSRMPSSA